MYVVGVDVGTTGTKAMLLNEKGEILSKAYAGYQLIKPGKNMVEQRAGDWWDAFVETVRKCTRDIEDVHDIAAISLSTQGGSLVPVDKNGRPLRDVIVWMDTRGHQQENDLREKHPTDFYYEKTGWGLIPGMNLVEIKWIKDNENGVFKDTYKFLSTLDYMNFKLTGNFVIDPTNAGITQLMNLREGIWDGELLELAGITEDRLPVILDAGVNVGNLSDMAAKQLGLDTSVNVINGGHDQYCAATGAGALHEGDLLLSAGTAWVILGITGKPLFDTRTHIGPGRHIVKGLWGALASIPTGGASMEWFRDNFALNTQTGGEKGIESFNDIDKKAANLMEKTAGLFFYPYFNGSCFPHYNDRLKASFLGLGLEHGRYDMARAVMEGIAFEVKAIIEYFKDIGNNMTGLIMLGGASRSQLWAEIIANVLDLKVIRFKEADMACVGAAIIAGTGCGMFKDYYDGANRISREKTDLNPDESLRNFYHEKYMKYKKGIEFLKSYYSGGL